MSERVWRTLDRTAMTRGPVSEAVLRFAVVLWIRDPAHGLSAVQVDWLRTRVQDLTPFTPHEHAKLVPLLLGWSQGKGCASVLVQGLRGVVDDALLPEQAQAKTHLTG
jgi:hypothetical protein